ATVKTETEAPQGFKTLKDNLEEWIEKYKKQEIKK
ncbi:RNA-binding protein S1, partial [Metabacillus fastidiosus]|nr:RNA-binding protein S1 [Metabacillus fastidiosus]